MARTAPAPNIPPIPGMCPSIAVLAGGGDGGGGSGDSSGKGDGDDNAGANQGGENAEGDSRGAPDYEKYPQCGYASHPVDVVTGRAFTHPIVDLELPGPLPLRFSRMYSSKMASRDTGLGFGWAHSFGWEVEVGRRRVTVWNEQGVAVDFPMLPVGGETLGPWGWVLRRDSWGFAVDANDGVWRIFSAPDSEGRRYKLTAIEDRNRNRIALTYDDGRLVEIVDSAGRKLRIVPTSEGRIASIQVLNAVSQGQWVAFATYTYDAKGNLSLATDAEGFASQYEYDDDHRITLDVDRGGLAFHFVYDREGRCVESWGDYPGRRDPSLAEDLPRYLRDEKTRAKGIHHCKFDYHADGYTEVIDSTEVRRFFGTKHGTLAKKVEGPAVTTATYRSDGHLLSHTDALGHSTHFERDARGRVTRITDPLSRVTSIERDVAGLPVQVVSPDGRVTRSERDARGNALILVDAAGTAMSVAYEARGLPLRVADARGGITHYEYDDQGNCVTVTEPNGAVWRNVFDALGRRLAQTDPIGATTRYAYSARGDLLAIFDAAGNVTRYAYDGERRLVRSTDPSGQSTTFTWGGYHKLCERRSAVGSAVTLSYDREGSLLMVRDERGGVHRLEYDAAARLIGEITLDGRELRYRLDLLGRPIVITDGLRNKTKMTYDACGQLVERELPDGAQEAFEYDAMGLLAGARWSAGEVRYERDALGRVVREAQRIGDVEHWVDSEYDVAGNRIARRTSLGHAEAAVRDAAGGRVHTTLDGDHVVEHTRDLLGREIARTLPRGGRIDSAYDPLGRLSERRASGPAARRVAERGEPEWLGMRADGITAAVAYQWDVNGELVVAMDRQRGRTQYEYDPLGQLVAMVPDKARAEVFRYDPAGNLHEDGPSAPARAYDAKNRVLQRGAETYAWDGGGRLVERSRRTRDGADEIVRYRWNDAGLLEAMEGPGGVVVEFAYDPFARRLQKRVTRPASDTAPPSASLTRFVWDGDVLVHEIKESTRGRADPVIEERTYWFEDSGFAPAAHREVRRGDDVATGGGWFHYLNDPAGTPERLIGTDGSVACELQRSAWGQVSVEPGAVASTPLRLPGHYEDDEAGAPLCYARFRYYDPILGRFISPDPLGINGSLNTYQYALNPIGWIDPIGLLFARKYKRDEVRRNLAASEGRNPTTGAAATTPNEVQGHAQRQHGSISDADLQARADADHANRSSFKSCAQQTRATADALNSPQGQAALAQLDANPGLNAVNFTAPVSSTARVAQPGGTSVSEENKSNVFVRVYRLPNNQLHIQTSYPR